MNCAISTSHHATASGAADATRPAVRGRVEKSVTRTVNFLQLNINGTQRKLAELSDILISNNIHVACLQETKLNQKLSLKIKGYTTIRKDRPNSSGGGLAFLIKTPEIKFTEVLSTFLSDTSTEAHAINVLLPDHTITVINVYHPDNSPIDTDLLQDLASSNSETKMILGDLNAKSPSWGSKLLDSKGTQVEDLANDLNLTILNTGENTYISKTNGTASALDITTISHLSADRTHWRVLDSAISDHYPVLTTFSIDRERPSQSKRSWNFRKADWPGFTQELENLCSEPTVCSNLEELLSLFASRIQNAAKHHIPRGKRKDNWIPFWKDYNIEALIKERDQTSKELQTNNSEKLRYKLIEVSHKVEEAISASKQEKWTELCERLDPRKGSSQYWNLIRALNNSSSPAANIQEEPQSNVISTNGSNARTDKETANLLAKHYETSSKLQYTAEDKKVNKKYKFVIKRSRKMTGNNIFTSDFGPEELESAINRLDQKKSPGPDLIFGQMITHFGENAKRDLLNIFNISWRSGKLPKSWKNSVIVPILKPGKSASKCANYRPISLTCILCKLMERIIHTRLMNWITENNILHSYQTAYRANHSTVDQLFYLCQSIIDGFQNKPHKKTTMVLLDLSAAFDRVWRQKLINILHKSGITSNALIWINDFLRKRSFKVRVNGSFSTTHHTWAGVPQGSVLSPLLFLLYMNTIDPYISKEIKIACYADDIAVWHTHSNLKVSQKALNICMKSIEIWSKDLKLKINPDKTNFCVFSTDRKNRSSFHPIIKLLGSEIKQTSDPKYLGLTLDAELRFSKHLELASNKALKKLSILRKLCGASWGSSPKILKNTYTSVIRPVLEYAAPIWASARPTVKEKIDAVQYRASKIITGAVSSTNNIKIEKECGLAPLESRRKLTTIKFTNKIQTLADHHISSRTFKAWSGNCRLKRSSTLQFDQDIRNDINLKYETLKISKEPYNILCPLSQAKICLNLLQPCTKKDPTAIIKEKGEHTIEKLTTSTQDLTIAYTDGSSDSNLDRGGAGVFFIGPDGEQECHGIPVGKIASNYTCELVAIKSALEIYLSRKDQSSRGIIILSDCRSALQAIQKGKCHLTHQIIELTNIIIASQRSCILQWIPAHVNIFGNEKADELAKASRNSPQPSNRLTLVDANAAAGRRLLGQQVKRNSIPDLNCDRVISTIITRLRTNHLKGMRISADGQRSYTRFCTHCPDNIPLSPQHIFSCPAIQAKLLKIFGIEDPAELLYTDRTAEVAKAVFDSFGAI